MTRDEILAWLREHQASVQGDPEEALDRAEREVRRRAEREAWLHAKRIAEEKIEFWNRRSRGIPSPEDWVAEEFCRELARELKHMEPKPDQDEAHWVDPEALSPFDREAREQLRSWVRDLAGEEEHRVWREVRRFTNARAKSLIREGEVSTEDRWEYTHSYAETAARLAAILSRDYEEHARAGKE
jgi:hypothetical protein